MKELILLLALFPPFVAKELVAKVTTLHPERRDNVLFGCAEGLILAL
jgi:hypothetical protein